MIVLLNRTNTFKVGFGANLTGYTVSYRLLNSIGGEVSTWSTVGVVEIGNGNYGIVLTPTLSTICFIEWRAVKAEQTTVYAIEDITAINNFTSDVSTIKKVLVNRMKIVSNQLIIYDDDKTTPLYTFDLKDVDGELSGARAIERTPAI